MSSDEQALQKGKWLDEYQAAKGKLITIHGRVRDIAKPVSGVANALQHSKLDAPGLGDYLSEWPTKEEIGELIAEARSANQTLKEVRGLLRQQGIEIT